MRLKKIKKTSICTVVGLSLLLQLIPMNVSAEELMTAIDCSARVNGQIILKPSDKDADKEEELKLGAYTNTADHRLYFSLTDLAKLLSGTEKQFDFKMDSAYDAYILTSGIPYTEPETTEPETQAEELLPEDIRIRNEAGEIETKEGDYYDIYGNLLNAADKIIVPAKEEPLVRPDSVYLELYQNPLWINGSETSYYTYQLSAFQDIYMNAIDIELALGITFTLEGNTVSITTDGYDININEFVDDGYFDLYNGVILGDATTGEILFGIKEDNPDAIASTSKLMTYLITMRYVELGKIHLDDVVTLSDDVEWLSLYSGYGTLYMEAGYQLTVADLLGALMLASSNESALALAEHVAGSEEKFVEMMNVMAQMLGLDTAVFYNTNGLPQYTNTLIASKVQNYMSVRDLFKLSMAVLRKYPQVTDYSSQKSMYLPTLNMTVYNTNQLLYNMSNVIGLKTGTTDEAGCCLVAAANVYVKDELHTLVAIIMGADSNLDRYQVPQLLLNWGEQKLNKSAEVVVNSEAADTNK